MSTFQTPLELARALIVKGDVSAAVPKLCEVLNTDFYHPEALYLLGGCLIDQGQDGLAAVVTSAAIDARAAQGKVFPEARLNLGTAYKQQHKNAMAERIWLDALKQETLPKERSKILGALSGLFVNEGCPEKALRYCDLALREDPHNAGVMVNRGLACLELRRWKEGWHGLSHTVLTGAAAKRNVIYRDRPDWDGAPGQTVIVYGDQGVGDEIFFAQCLPEMQARCKRVIFDCHPRLPALFARSFPGIEVHGTRKHLQGSDLDWIDGCDADAVVALSNLPAWFRLTDESWGDGWAYLSYRLIDNPGAHVDGPRIGLSWTGGTKKTHEHYRSLPIAELEPILRARPDAQWFSLQYTPNAAREVCELEERTGVRISHFPGWVECFDYDRTASFVASLDLVITVCTTAHHLGGALGVPTWTLVPSRPNWRYQLKGDRLPWYGSVRLFRQERDGDWSGAIERVAGELAHFR